MATTKRQVFYSFHFDNDVMRVQQIRNMGIVDGDQPVSPNEWEQLKKKDGGASDPSILYQVRSRFLNGVSAMDWQSTQ